MFLSHLYCSCCTRASENPLGKVDLQTQGGVAGLSKKQRYELTSKSPFLDVRPALVVYKACPFFLTFSKIDSALGAALFLKKGILCRI